MRLRLKGMHALSTGMVRADQAVRISVAVVLRVRGCAVDVRYIGAPVRVPARKCCLAVCGPVPLPGSHAADIATWPASDSRHAAFACVLNATALQSNSASTCQSMQERRAGSACSVLRTRFSDVVPDQTEQLPRAERLLPAMVPQRVNELLASGSDVDKWLTVSE